MDLTSPIVVGVSRRTGSPDAVRWAAAEAQLRDTRVIAVTAWRGPRPPAMSGGRPPALSPAPIEEAFALEQQRIFDRLSELLGGDPASMRVEFALRRGSASAVLLAAAVGAQLLVLDSPHAGNFSMLAKSLIAPQVVFKAPCPVVLMPPGADTADDVLPTGGLTSV
ncbi:MAG: universal stress protein [Actinomycetota bacterium]|nr:universal stress protein [Actinomycetota bacterium]